jgi:hypothetical protein
MRGQGSGHIVNREKALFQKDANDDAATPRGHRASSAPRHQRAPPHVSVSEMLIRPSQQVE